HQLRLVLLLGQRLLVDARKGKGLELCARLSETLYLRMCSAFSLFDMSGSSVKPSAFNLALSSFRIALFFFRALASNTFLIGFELISRSRLLYSLTISSDTGTGFRK